MPFKIVCAQPKKGIERSLPYVLEDRVDAIIISGSLDSMLKSKGYEHRVEPVQPSPVVTPYKRGKKHAR